MRRWAAVALLASMAATAQGQDVVYRKSRILGQRKRVELTFLEQERALVLERKGVAIERIPLDAIDRLSFVDSKRRRWREAGGLLYANSGAGILIIFTLPLTVVVAVPWSPFR